MQCASSIATSGQARSPQQRAEGRRRESLGRDVDQLALAVRDAAHPAADLGRVERAREIRRRDPARVERGDLVVHQRDQRRDDERGAGQQAGGELVDEALAAAGGRDQQQPPGFEQRLDGLALSGPERFESETREPRLERRLEGYVRSRRHQRASPGARAEGDGGNLAHAVGIVAPRSRRSACPKRRRCRSERASIRTTISTARAGTRSRRGRATSSSPPPTRPARRGCRPSSVT